MLLKVLLKSFVVSRTKKYFMLITLRSNKIRQIRGSRKLRNNLNLSNLHNLRTNEHGDTGTQSFYFFTTTNTKKISLRRHQEIALQF